ncbi:MAG: PAS domain S-box protein [Candidatus Riflebacteria bacterium]|nr:PAS domain S-box protein [Candidatus Riflebacteria bacterium]
MAGPKKDQAKTPPQKTGSPPEASLRLRAEEWLAHRRGAANLPPTRDPQKLLQDLATHQIELQMQNEELQRSQEELEKARARYFDLYDLAPVGYLTLGAEGRILEANLTAAGMLGCEKQRLVGKRFTDFILPEFQDTFYFHRKSLFQDHQKRACELKLRRGEGEPFFARLESTPGRGGSDQPDTIRTSLIDMHESVEATNVLKAKAAQNELLLNLLPHPAMLIDQDRKILAANAMARRNGARIGDQLPAEGSSVLHPPRFPQRKRPPAGMTRGVFHLTVGEIGREKLVTVFEDSDDALTVLDREGNIKAWNRGAEKIYGFPAAEALKMTVFDLVPPRLRKETMTLLRDIAAGVLVQPFETKRIARDGSLLDIRVKVIRLVQNGEFFGISTTERNVTEHNQWLAMIRRLPKRIILAREKERARIAQVIHGDLGQALMALKIFCCVSASELNEGKARITPVFDQLKGRITGIMDKARSLSHELAPPGLQHIGLPAAIRHMIEAGRYGKKLKIHFSHRGLGGADLRSRGIILFRIVQEALNNIFKHARATEVWIKCFLLDTTLTLEIRDNGTGFDPSRGRTARGLGLDLMREHALLLHGVLDVDSSVGKGTTVKLSARVRPRKNPDGL